MEPLPGGELRASPDHHAALSGPNELGGVGQNNEGADAAGAGQIARPPYRIELRLEGAQPLEIVEVLAMAKDEMSDSVPAGGQRMSGEAGEGRHAEVEALVALGLEMLHQPHKKEVHCGA